MNNALVFGKFLLPADKTVYDTWPVIACDQYTSSPEYWESEYRRIGDAPSTLKLICPEAFLSDSDRINRSIYKTSREYLRDILKEYSGGVLVKRTVGDIVRYGLVCLADLEEYDYFAPSGAIRATEGTVVERIPPRLAMREISALDVSHVICLIDDPQRTVIEPLIGKGEPLYEVDLGKAGKLEGRLIRVADGATAALSALGKNAAESGRPFVLVGDGNHSLAAAKVLYEGYKKAGDARAENARYALVEVENLRSDGVVFHPIHRVIYGGDVTRALAEGLKGEGSVRVCTAEGEITLSAPSDAAQAYKSVQSILDRYLSEHKDARIDYIHGDEEVRRLCAEAGGCGVLMPSLDKDGLFGYIAENGVLPRKSFSMGEADEKRFYMECRKISDD